MNDAVPWRQAMRRELETTRTAFHALLAEIPPRAWLWPTANPAWTIGQTMVHITMFLQYLPGDVALIRRGWPQDLLAKQFLLLGCNLLMALALF